MKATLHVGASYALVSAVLFGLSTPLAKVLVGSVPPVLLAGLLYLGSGIGLLLVYVVRSSWFGSMPRWSLPAGAEWRWLAGAVVFGGVIGPVALMFALRTTPASSASLLLNLESVFTALLAWFVFRENVDRRVALGMLAIVLGGLVLAWMPGEVSMLSWGAVLIAGACLCWALDNNLTRRVAAGDAVFIAGVKGIVAGTINVVLALALGNALPSPADAIAPMLLGFLAYGISLTLFVHALRHLGTARAGAYFAVAPFFGAALAIVFSGEPVTWQLLAAAALMTLGVWLHLAEHHEHPHAHAPQTHAHRHRHDAHHRHDHDFPWDGREPHAHPHSHAPAVHSHPHFPDVHHRHEH